MSYSISSWDDEYARISRAASQLRTIPNNHHNPSTSSSSSSPSTSRQQQIHSIQTGLSRLKQSLYTMKGNGVINQSNGDYQRRMGLIEHLENQFGSNDRDLLGMGNSSSGGGGTTTTTNNNNDYYNSNNNDYSSSISSSRMSTTTQALRHQDQMIDELASGVARLKDQTFMINDEANMQNRMLDNVSFVFMCVCVCVFKEIQLELYCFLMFIIIIIVIYLNNYDDVNVLYIDGRRCRNCKTWT